MIKKKQSQFEYKLIQENTKTAVYQAEYIPQNDSQVKIKADPNYNDKIMEAILLDSYFVNKNLHLLNADMMQLGDGKYQITFSKKHL